MKKQHPSHETPVCAGVAVPQNYGPLPFSLLRIVSMPVPRHALQARVNGA